MNSMVGLVLAIPISSEALARELGSWDLRLLLSLLGFATSVFPFMLHNKLSILRFCGSDVKPRGNRVPIPPTSVVMATRGTGAVPHQSCHKDGRRNHGGTS